MDFVKVDENTCQDDEEWANLMDRGGLWHVKYTTEDVQFYWLIATTDYIKSFFKNWSLDGKV